MMGLQNPNIEQGARYTPPGKGRVMVTGVIPGPADQKTFIAVIHLPCQICQTQKNHRLTGIG